MLLPFLLLSVINISVDSELSKIKSFEIQQKIYNILHSEDPSHYERLWMVGFLKYVGYTVEEICDIINAEASWIDYDARVTYCQVSSIFRRQYLHKKGVGCESATRCSNYSPSLCDYKKCKGFVALSSISSRSGAWVKHEDYEKLYHRPLCAIHADIHCPSCPDNVGHKCKWVKSP